MVGREEETLEVKSSDEAEVRSRLSSDKIRLWYKEDVASRAALFYACLDLTALTSHTADGKCKEPLTANGKMLQKGKFRRDKPWLLPCVRGAAHVHELLQEACLTCLFSIFAD